MSVQEYATEDAEECWHSYWLVKYLIKHLDCLYLVSPTKAGLDDKDPKTEVIILKSQFAQFRAGNLEPMIQI